MSVSVEKMLEESYRNGLNLIEFIRQVRTEKNDGSGKYNCGLKDVSNLFPKLVWKHVPGAGGHIVVKHKLTKVVINFSNHKDPVDPGAVVDIAEKIQKHVNHLGERIFGLKTWKEKPDFKALAKMKL